MTTPADGMPRPMPNPGAVAHPHARVIKALEGTRNIANDALAAAQTRLARAREEVAMAERLHDEAGKDLDAIRAALDVLRAQS